MSLIIGVLAIQGDVLENVLSVKSAIDALDIDGTVTSVKTPDEISNVDGLVIPGGESTTIGQLSVTNGSLNVLKEKNFLKLHFFASSKFQNFESEF